MIANIVQIGIGIGVVWVVSLLDRNAGTGRYSRNAPRGASGGSELEAGAWIRDAVDNDRGIRRALAQVEWFTVTDVARVLQGVGRRRKPSGSANRDARLTC